MSSNDTNYNQTSNTNVNPAQVQNYITWINSHLKKRPGVKLVENLHIDITNGVPLIHLIEVISGNVLADVNLNPKSAHEYKENIDKVLKFMQANNVKIARTTSKEILDGNIKSIMRVILALAAHFKPSNLQAAPNRQSLVSTSSLPSSTKSSSNVLTNLNQQNPKTTTTRALTNIDSMTHLVQAACVSFADVRRYKNENFNVKYVRRNNLLQNGQTTSTTTTSTTSLATSPVYKEKFNLTTTLGNAPTSAAADTADLAAVNNKTFVKSTSCLNTKSPIRRILRPHLEQTGDEYSFSNSALLSPSHQHPIASSTILSQTLLHSKPLDERLINKNQTYSKNIEIDNANQTNIINETKESDCRNKTEQLNTNSTSTTSSTTKHNTLNNNNNTIVLSRETKLNEPHQQIEQTTNDLIEVPEEMLDDVKNLKSVLLNLQSLLMTGDLRDLDEEIALASNLGHEIKQGEENENNASLANKSLSSTDSSKEDEFALANLTKEEQISILRSKIQQLEILNNDLKSELNQTKSESMNNYGIQSGLKSRLTELDNNILELKNEQINLQLTNQQLVNEKEKLLRLLDEQTNEINKIKCELNVRDEIIEKMRLEMSSLVKTNLLKKQIKNIADLEEIQEKESVLSGMIANRKLCIIDSKLANATGKKADSTFIVNKCKQASKPAISDEETSLIRDTLNQLKHNFKPSHPSLFLIDTLEQTILSISQRTSDLDIANSNDYTTKSNGKMPAPASIGLITSSTSSINSSSSSSSSNSSSVASSSANSPVLSNLNQFQPNQMCTIYSSSQMPVRLTGKRLETLTTTTSSINKLNNKDIEIPTVNTAEQTNVKKIISRLLSQTNTNQNGTSSSAVNLVSPSLAATSSSSAQQAANSHHAKKKLETEFIQPKSQANSCASSMLLTISSGSSSASASASSTHSPSSSSSSTSSISNLNGSTKCIYFKNKETTPYMTTLFKSINNVTLFDFKERIAKQLDHSRKYRFYFKSHEPEFGYLREEITNENTLLPTFDNQIVAWIVENE